jgi:hypothetical protein
MDNTAHNIRLDLEKVLQRIDEGMYTDALWWLGQAIQDVVHILEKKVRNAK